MPTAARTYRIAAFAALAGVTPRALRHYERLGLLRPGRSHTGYRLYAERDLETVEEIVALKFIGVPLKEIAAIRQRAKGPFVHLLRAQREALETRRRSLSRAIAAIAAAEASLQSGAAPEAQLIRRIIEVMHMDEPHDAVTTYIGMLKAKAEYLASLSPEQRADLKHRWALLLADIRETLHEDPAGPHAQALLDRWLLMLRELAGPAQAELSGAALDLALRPVSGMRDELWARRAEWLPAGAADNAPATAADAAAAARKDAEAFVGSDIVEFIRRARAARG